MTSRPASPRRRRPLAGRSIPSALAALPLLALALVGCGGSDDEADASASTGTTERTATTVGASTAAPTPSTTSVTTTSVVTSDTADLATIPSGTGDLPPVGTGDIPLPPVTADLPYQVSVTVGLDDDPERIERVPLGATVALTITNPDADDEFHLHGYELGDGVVMPAGQPETFTFVADRAGSFEVESHETGDVLMILEVV